MISDRCPRGGFLEALPGGRTVALQELPFANIELRLAAAGFEWLDLILIKNRIDQD